MGWTADAQGPGKVQNYRLKALWTTNFRNPDELPCVRLGQLGVHNGHPMGHIPRVSVLYGNSTCTARDHCFLDEYSEKFFSSARGSVSVSKDYRYCMLIDSYDQVGCKFRGWDVLTSEGGDKTGFSERN